MDDRDEAYEREWAAKGHPDRSRGRRASGLALCRVGCKTQDHDSYADCLKAAAIQIGNLK